jgi:hemoglobin
MASSSSPPISAKRSRQPTLNKTPLRMEISYCDMNTTRKPEPVAARPATGCSAWAPGSLAVVFLLSLALGSAVGCHSGGAQKQSRDFFTSGSREADQRASQRMAQAEQLGGSGEGAGERGAQKAVPLNANMEGPSSGATNTVLKVEGKVALFERLGGEAGISNIVEDFTPRVLNDPRVNWTRNGVKRGGFSIHRGQSVAWSASPDHVAQLKKHLAQFLALATGGPARYEGKDMKSAHAGLHIANPEFDAAIGDLKASLDKLQLPNREQKELLAIIESTRAEIVVER